MILLATLPLAVSRASAAPGAPTIGTATAPDAASAIVSWTPPADTTNLVGYQVIPRIGTTNQVPISVPGTSTTYTVTGLTNGESYTFLVRSVYTTGTFTSGVSNAVTPYGLPGAPGSVTLTTGDGQLSVSWLASAPNGSPVSSYEVSVSPADSPAQTLSGSSNSATFTGLTNGTSYTVTVRATNQRGSTSAQSPSARPVGPPDAPSGVDATPGDGSATVTWNAPIDSGGSDIASYTVFITNSGVTTSAQISNPSQRSYTATNLTNGQTYTFAVSATNQASLTSAVSTSDTATPADAVAPIINSSGLVPSGGPVGGSFVIEILGSNLSLVSAVTFVCTNGTRTGTIVGTPTATKVTVSIPACAAGAAQVSVSGAGGSSAAVTFNYRTPPTIQAVTPSSGPRSGGYDVAITGSGFVSGRTAVRIGGRPAVIRTISSTALTVLVPGLDAVDSAGARDVSVVVDSSSGLTVVSSGGFVYTNPSSGGGGVGGGGGAPSPALPTPVRLAGNTRFDTSARVSAEYFAPGVEVAYVATGRSFADALAAGPAAWARGPVLIVEPGNIPTTIATELQRLRPRSIVVLGGTAAVSETVKSQLGRYTTGSVARVGGSTRYETAAQLSRIRFSPGVPVVYVSTGENFADALAAAPALQGRGPILLTSRDSLPVATRDEIVRLKPGRVVVVGGTSAVSENVRNVLAGLGSAPVVRVSGPDRFATATEVIANASFERGGTVFLATGLDFADALSAAPVGLPIFLARSTCIPSLVLEAIEDFDPDRVMLLGGSAALGSTVANWQRC